MTVCIAAVCEENIAPKIVICTDRKVGGALGSAETMLKTRWIGNGWKCLTSGTDNDILATLRLFKNHVNKEQIIDETNVLRIVRAALNERKFDKANELIQGKFAIPYSEFLAAGKARFPDDQFRAVMSEVELIEIEAVFIIVGFADRFPILIKTDRTCGAVIKEDHVVIGEGGYLAQAALLSREHHNIETLERTLYSVFEAKKFAEGVPSVGTTTAIYVLYADGGVGYVTAEGNDFLEEQYKQFGPKKLCGDALSEFVKLHLRRD